MRLTFDETGKITLVENVNNEAGITDNQIIVSDANIPVDFMSTFALGKYKVVNGALTQIAEWIRPSGNRIVREL